MKRALIFVLMIALMVSLAVPAFAATASVAADKKDLAPEVFVVSSSCDELKNYTVEDVADLPEEAQKAFAEAKEKLAEVVPEGMAARYFFYVDICDLCNDATAVFNVGEYAKEDELVVMQFVDGKWVELEYTVNTDGTITVYGLVDGPVAIFVKAGQKK